MIATVTPFDPGMRKALAPKPHAPNFIMPVEYEQEDVPKVQQPEENTPDNIRPSGPAPTQQNDKGVTKSQEPEENKPENNRPTKTPPTQEMVDRDELRQAMSLIRAFPYGGDDTQKLGLSQDDLADVNYCIDWLTEALEAYVAAQYKPDALYDSENCVAIEQCPSNN